MKNLVISNLTKMDRGRLLLDDINVTLSTGNIYGFVGHNGAGKSTLFKTILGLTSYVGSISVDGEKITLSNYSSFLKRIGVVFPFPESFEDFTVQEVFEDYRHYFDVPKVRIEEYLMSYGLNVSISDKLSMFSLGMKQRLNIALALLHAPDILILDEPFNGLDREGVELLQKILVHFKEMNKLVLISSHSFVDMEDICDYFILIEKGAIISHSTKQEYESNGFLRLEDYYRAMSEAKI